MGNISNQLLYLEVHDKLFPSPYTVNVQCLVTDQEAGNVDEKILEGPGHDKQPATFMPTCFEGSKICAESGNAYGLQVGSPAFRVHGLPPTLPPLPDSCRGSSSKARAMQKEEIRSGCPEQNVPASL